MEDKGRKLIGSRMKKFREEKHWSREMMAEKLGMKTPNYGNVERGEQYPTIEQLKIIVSISDIPYSYWVDGEPEPSSTFDEPSLKYGSAKAIDLGSMIIMHVPLVNQYAYGGYMRGFSDVTYIDTLPKTPWMVEREYKGNYMSFEVKGDSMDDGSRDSYIDGDILLCREISNDLWTKNKLHIKKWDFVIVHKTEGIVIKRITSHEVEKGIINLHSLNEQYSDYEVKLKHVLKIFNVVKVERKK